MLLEIKNVSKSFSGVCVLQDIMFRLDRGKVHAIVGENGAGKSTFIKILSGAYTKDCGEITIEGACVDELNPRIAQEMGIVTIYQERNLLPFMSVAENILLGNIPVNRFGVVQWKEMYQKTKGILEHLNLSLDPKAIVGTLSSAEQQAVEIAKALYKNAKIVIMDEPTASLTKAEIDNLFDLIRKLKEKGVSLIYISHRLDEIFQIADMVTVLRDGAKVLETDIEHITKSELVKAMVGEELQFTHVEDSGIGEQVLDIQGISRTGFFSDVSLTLRRGEIFGFAGMVGSGRTSVVRSLAGIDPIDEGKILFKGEDLKGRTLTDFINRGICFVPEDRDCSGIIARMSVAGNTTLACLRKISRGLVIDLGKEREIAEQYVKTLAIAAKSISQEVQYLSGGNRQKVMLAKWLCLGFEMFIMDEPSQGVDVGAREEIHQIMKRLLEEGKAIIMVSSDLDELMNMSNRIAVMNNGRISAILTTKETTREEVISYAIRKQAEAI